MIGLISVEKAEKKGLTPQQFVFMTALQDVIVKTVAPASADQLRVHMKKSDSRVRSHIKVLMHRGYVCCVGKDRVKRYVPSMLWMEEGGDRVLLEHIGLACIGGYCSTHGCKQMAEDYWRDGYYCRQCIVGHDWISDNEDIRRRYEENMTPPSAAGRVLEYVWPTYSEDILARETGLDEVDILDIDTKKKDKDK